jgi:hypothetical protein
MTGLNNFPNFLKKVPTRTTYPGGRLPSGIHPRIIRKVPYLSGNYPNSPSECESFVSFAVLIYKVFAISMGKLIFLYSRKMQLSDTCSGQLICYEIFDLKRHAGISIWE